ncbi:hypothetical protein SDC9_209653 [bioreactor metagenome]|uniref:Uncharacterized protein n=1 Tax=bioreactor metagenome TaxID=1076179 RepID=A0A645JEW8_9ZZZZ
MGQNQRIYNRQTRGQTDHPARAIADHHSVVAPVSPEHVCQNKSGGLDACNVAAINQVCTILVPLIKVRSLPTIPSLHCE